MKLQILIPQYKEDEQIIRPLLDSIALQQNIDFNDIGVIIVNDGSDVILSEEFLNSYPYIIKYYQNEHKGVSATRNACIDYAMADYIMFCDADDMFFNMCGLWIIFKEIQNGEFDGLLSVFVEETRYVDNEKQKEIIYINREMDQTFVHGKVWRRQYLINNNIRWNVDLTIHEDSFFNIQAINYADPNRIKICPNPFYLWKWRDESVCRHDPKYMLKTFVNMIDSNDALIEEFNSRHKEDEVKFFIAQMFFDSYYMMNKPEWKNQENVEYRDMTERRFNEYVKKYKCIWDNIPENEKMFISQQIRQRNVMEGMEMENMTIETWLVHIESLGDTK